MAKGKMRRCGALAALLSLVSISSVLAQGIKGHIYENGKDPLFGVSVHVSQNGALQGYAATDYDGIYIVKPLNAGLYSIIVTLAGYDTIRETVTVTDSVTVFDHSLKAGRSSTGRVPPRCNIGGIRNRTILGKVANAQGHTVPGAIVELYRNRKLYEHTVVGKNGAYEFSCTDQGVVDASYTLRSFHSGYDTVDVHVDLTGLEIEQDIYLKRQKPLHK